MQRLLDFFGSLRLTLCVLLILALAASGGTIWPVEQLTDQGAPIKRFDLYYQALWFRALLGLLIVNLAVCTWRTLHRTLGTRQRLTTQVAAGLPASDAGYPCPPASAEQLGARLTASGYRVMPTRCSWTLRSFGTPMIMAIGDSCSMPERLKMLRYGPV